MNTSTQKGYVTSNSMEILCYLALGKDEYEKFVQKKGKYGKKFDNFFKEIREKIEENA